MNYTQKILSVLLLVVGGVFTSCEKDEISTQDLSLGITSGVSQNESIEAPKFINDERKLSAIATLGTVGGEFGELYVNKYGGQVITLNDLSDYNPKTAGYIHYDIDKVNFTEEEFKELKNWADENDACLIFESGSKDFGRMKEFYTTFIINEDPNYDVRGILIENSSKTTVTRTTLISEDVSWSNEDVIKYSFNELKEYPSVVEKAASFVTPTSVKSYPDKKKTCRRGKCTTILGTPLYTTTNKFMSVPANDNYRVLNIKYTDVQGSMHQWGATNRTPIRYGYVHDAMLYGGEYTCNQSASYAEGLTYTKSWTVGLGASSGALSKFFPNLVKKIQDVAFTFSPSIGYSKAEGTTNTTSFAMKNKRYARAVVYASVYKRNLGFWKGTVEYTVKRRTSSTSPRNRWRTVYKAKSIFNGHGADNSWNSDQPFAPNNNKVTRISVGWEEWGTKLNCN